MRKSLLILFIGSLLIISGCSAKEDLKELKSEGPSQKIEKTESGNTTSKDRRDDIKAPDFKLATIDGKEFYLSDFAGKVIMLNFWGTWCPPCRKEIPDLISLHTKYNKDGLEVIGITLNSGSAKDIKKFANGKDMNYTLLTDLGNDETISVTNLYGQTIGQPISSIPTTLIIDRAGYIVKGYLGARSEEVFYNDLKEFL